MLKKPVLELIDTCWDVNMSITISTITSSIRINRYMLGCKYGKVHLIV